MIKLNGTGASGGLAMGKLYRIRHDSSAPVAAFTSVSEEQSIFLRAKEKLAAEYDELAETALAAIGTTEAEIFEIHKMMLEDDDFLASVDHKISSEMTAHEAVLTAADEIGQTFRNMDSEYMKARAADVKAIANRLADIIAGNAEHEKLTEPVIVAADDLSPAETVGLDRRYLLGFVTEGGSTLSHTAILARMLGIPAVVSVGRIDEELDGKTAVIDGESGVVSVMPDRSTIAVYDNSVAEQKKTTARLEAMRGVRCRDEEGSRIRVCANIGEPDDVDFALANDAEGIGLFRSEFIFMRRDTPPTEEEQFAIYRSAVEKMAGEECVVRTLDVGADKKIPYLSAGKESNPALGIRAVRLCMKMPEILITQFRALYRAAVYGNLSAMIPMIVLPSEVSRVKELARQARESLLADGTEIGTLRLGIMIETPSAAILSDILAPMVDFFSIGTNDLIQYTLAADRENPALEYLTKPLPESVRRCIRMTCNAAKREEIPVCVCGELGADIDETEFLLDAGVNKLSVAPSKILAVREQVNRITSLSPITKN